MIEVDKVLQPKEISEILERLSDQFYQPFLRNKDKATYSKKLSAHAKFALFRDKLNTIKGIIAYYFSSDNNEVFIPLVWVDNQFSGMGIATKMFQILHTALINRKIISSKLEVRKTNLKAISLYQKVGYNIIDETEERFIMKIDLKC